MCVFSFFLSSLKCRIQNVFDGHAEDPAPLASPAQSRPMLNFLACVAETAGRSLLLLSFRMKLRLVRRGVRGAFLSLPPWKEKRDFPKSRMLWVYNLSMQGIGTVAIDGPRFE